MNQLSNFQIFQRSRAAREHRHLDLALRQLHHLGHVLCGNRRGFQELSRHASQRRTQRDALGDVESVFETAAGEDRYIGRSFPDIQDGFRGGDAPADKRRRELAGELVRRAVHFDLRPTRPARAGHVNRGDTAIGQNLRGPFRNSPTDFLRNDGYFQLIFFVSPAKLTSPPACTASCRGLRCRMSALARIISTARRQ
jgi:hypothetical protein